MTDPKTGAASSQIVPGRSSIGAPAILNGQGSAAKAAQKGKQGNSPPEIKDGLREVIETVVFVVVLVLLLKSFVAEAFVIPTGSMAETLYGYQKIVKCPKCDLEFPVNCSSEVDPQQGPPVDVVGAICPSCRYQIELAKDKPSWNTGDRVLVAKFLYDFGVFGLDMPERFQVVVFKFPESPQKQYIPLNYIKRLVGLPSETIAIYYGKLYKYDGLNYPEDDRVPLKELWEKRYQHQDDPLAQELFSKGKFQILRKGPKQSLAERRLVFDNDHQAKDLINKAEPRWQPEAKIRWSVDDAGAPKVFTHGGGEGQETAWLRYRDLISRNSERREDVRKELITDFMGYNTWEQPAHHNAHQPPPENWVGDLMLECDVKITKPQGELILELSKGVDRFQARWDLTSGICSLMRKGERGIEKLSTHETNLKKTGTYHLRFADFDQRLTLWVDSSLPFGDGVPYEAPSKPGPTDSDLDQPVSIGANGGEVAVSKLKLWRDTYYTVKTNQPDAGEHIDYDRPNFELLNKLPVMTMYVQPGHFLCMGDNSPESSDGRMWGSVPQRLMLGRAMMIYYPFSRVRPIE